MSTQLKTPCVRPHIRHGMASTYPDRPNIYRPILMLIPPLSTLPVPFSFSFSPLPFDKQPFSLGLVTHAGRLLPPALRMPDMIPKGYDPHTPIFSIGADNPLHPGLMTAMPLKSETADLLRLPSHRSHRSHRAIPAIPVPFMSIASPIARRLSLASFTQTPLQSVPPSHHQGAK